MLLLEQKAFVQSCLGEAKIPYQFLLLPGLEFPIAVLRVANEILFQTVVRSAASDSESQARIYSRQTEILFNKLIKSQIKSNKHHKF